MFAIRAGKCSRRALVAGTGAFALLALSACGTDSAAKKEPVSLVAPLWTGGQANTAVAKYILEKELGYEVTVEEMTEADGWKALGEGKADAVLEDWGLPEQVERYVEKEKTVVPGGPLGVTGRIGWFVPRYLADENREITRWENLNKYVELFRTQESDGKGVLFQGDPSFKSQDAALIKNLDLNYKLVHLGSEEAQLEKIRTRAEKEKPFLTYWWTPHWVEAEVGLAEVRLPEYYPGCDAKAEKTACGYQETELQKYLNAHFAKKGGNAAEFLKNFEWGEDEQNAVAKMIAGDGMSPEGAAEKWAKENEGIWKKWLWGVDD
ncbi:glycine betaine ABC transporter substrate-binding protein [Streptomyces gobiensis]|uniref:glycine betaine ABC transporter substrate-binding protein n=1 Tax=Streptomyces gobiensis TaxID=2875706 RepID=UPI001E44004A|nr:glycine betaine ABC transporter substrate-binding protein [Streptomyces gobiensis]UGY93234.1 glycine/betaine ABC transporter substrate-binding protein [Streptomyces gobiensis]